MLTQVKDWLASFPGWDNTRLWVDKSLHLPNSAALVCHGLTQGRRKADILGTATWHNQCKFSLHWVVSDSADPQAMAQKLLQLQHWVQTQDAAGLPPVLGENTHWHAHAGKRSHISHAMTAIYTVQLTADYETKIHNT